MKILPHEYLEPHGNNIIESDIMDHFINSLSTINIKGWTHI